MNLRDIHNQHIEFIRHYYVLIIPIMVILNLLSSLSILSFKYVYESDGSSVCGSTIGPVVSFPHVMVILLLVLLVLFSRKLYQSNLKYKYALASLPILVLIGIVIAIVTQFLSSRFYILPSTVRSKYSAYRIDAIIHSIWIVHDCGAHIISVLRPELLLFIIYQSVVYGAIMPMTVDTSTSVEDNSDILYPGTQDETQTIEETTGPGALELLFGIMGILSVGGIFFSNYYINQATTTTIIPIPLTNLIFFVLLIYLQQFKKYGLAGTIGFFLTYYLLANMIIFY